MVDLRISKNKFVSTISLIVQVEDTLEKVDLERLKQREKIHFYQDLLLFEDELADNGTSTLSVKLVGFL